MGVVTLTSISEYCAELNLSGLQAIEYVPVEYINDANYRWLTSPTWYMVGELDVGGSWLSVKVLPQGRLWNETMRRTAQGPVYDQKVGGIVRGLRPEVSGLLAVMEERLYILRITDRKGRVWVLGNKENWFEFSAALVTGDPQSGLASYNISFTAATPQRALGLEV